MDCLANPGPSCSSSPPLKKSKVEVEFMLQERISKSTEKISEFWKEDDRTKGSLTFCDGEVTIVKNPFRFGQVSNFLEIEEKRKFLNMECLMDELKSVSLVEKSSDLFNFKQSLNLASCSTIGPTLEALKTFLLLKVKPWLMAVTGINDLSDKIDMFCAEYSHGDYLLCHDDQLEGRRIAYILYLVDEDWNEKDGGALDLFSSEDGVPLEVVHSIVPKFNSFAFFPVSKRSFHQVREVLTRSRSRISVTGWFYGETLSTDPLHVRDELLASWINPKYFDETAQKEIRAKFSSSSDLSLTNFLDPEKYSKVLDSLISLQRSWINVGPPNERRYNRLELDPDEVNTPEMKIVGECLSFLKSFEFLSLLEHLTGIDLLKNSDFISDENHHNEGSDGDENSDAQSDEEADEDSDYLSLQSEVRWWKSGDYTLLQDKNFYGRKTHCLDVNLFFMEDYEWDQDWGGTTNYVALGESSQLVSVSPVSNSVSLVYREPEVEPFVKYLNYRASDKAFYDFFINVKT